MKVRIAVTGLGVVSSAGIGIEAFGIHCSTEFHRMDFQLKTLIHFFFCRTPKRHEEPTGSNNLRLQPHMKQSLRRVTS